MFTSVEIEISTKAATCYVEIYVEGDYESGGSNRWGSDEPAWAEWSNLRIYGVDGKYKWKTLPKRIEAYIWKEYEDQMGDWMDKESR